MNQTQAYGVVSGGFAAAIAGFLLVFNTSYVARALRPMIGDSSADVAAIIVSLYWVGLAIVLAVVTTLSHRQHRAVIRTAADRSIGVLVVGPDAVLCPRLANVLGTDKYLVVVTLNWDSALDTMGRVPFDAMVLDSASVDPERLEFVIKTHGDVPVIVVGDPEQRLRSRPSSHVRGPVPIEKLVTTLRDAVAAG